MDKHSASPPKKKQRGVYHVYDAKTRATIAKTAEACGLAKAAVLLEKSLGHSISKSTIQSIRKAY